MHKIKGLLKFIFGRTAIILFLLVLQIVILIASFTWLAEDMAVFYSIFTLLSGIVVIYIINEDENASFKLAWIIPVLVIPVFGTLLYIFVKLQLGARVIKKDLEESGKLIRPMLNQNAEVMSELEIAHPNEAGLVKYVKASSGYPMYGNSSAKYFSLGEFKFKEMLIQFEKAEKYIFLEYFIVSEGYMWNTVLEILKRKVTQGVEVRFMYDGMCSLSMLPYNYSKKLEQYGIRCKVFSPIKPILSTHQNNRDHRKILVIDGKVAFTGGVNLADEYINEEVRFGHWKDAAIMITGDAVKSFTIMFLQMWNVKDKVPEDYSRYISVKSKMLTGEGLSEGGFVMPYGDSPFDGQEIGKQVYLDILNRAKKYVHIMTPYLILDDEMIGALIYAAQRGVEIVIIMPHIPDKMYAYLSARTYYRELMEKGVKIYEYTPGFIHSKVFVSDDDKAVVGTINLDFRSLYLHFECAVYIYHNPVIYNIEADVQDTLPKCQEITLEACKKYPVHKQFIGQVLRLFAPLM